MDKKIIAIIALIIVVVAGIGIYSYSISNSPDTSKLRISTTTSLEDTGLLKELEAAYEKKYPGVDVQVVSGGTGIALQYGERGDVDLMLVHDKARETKFINDGFGTNRTQFAYNYFWIVGPADDPAGIKGLNATEAFKKIAQEGQTNSQVKFVSRGDASGTNARELKIWKSAGIDINNTTNGSSWYIESGKGMGDTLVIANEKNAYTISDSGTFLAYSKNGKITLVPLVTTGKDLLNIYTAIPINPDKHPKTNIEAANNFVNFLVSPEGQTIIGNYGKDKYGQALFTPVPTNTLPALIAPLIISTPA
ncbi:substrate-binding domain-containing protein [Methanobacterium congolense]|uniref:Putative ABC transporter anion-binding protein HVO_1888 n=1 Tax=Methanobacterium congolense TaxID=118062 RepID=A0A1D3KZM7_9EURY|nr:substrate-binding domain-containing protein [Methanobacterium congolense]SCG84738.1 putative ABC transporter anion-binding protein HVO_1888 [Methanobacterium congolense]